MPADDLPSLRSEMIALLGRVIGEKPLPIELQQKAVEIFAALVAKSTGYSSPSPSLAGLRKFSDVMATRTSLTLAGNRRLIYVHGICQHMAGFSDPWWDALHFFVPTAFGPGIRGETRFEVVWSDVVNEAAALLAAIAGDPGAVSKEESSRAIAAHEIKDALRDRADQEMVHATMGVSSSLEVPIAAGEPGALLDIPGVRCVDDFAIYLTNDGVRQQIIDRFIAVVAPQMQANRQVEIIGHSWGSVVAYEGLRQMEDQGFTAPLIRNFFTVGAALSIGPVKSRLRPGNRDGKKPANVQRWVNLDARGDLVGGPLKNRPYQVDVDLVNLEPFGCGIFLGLVNPSCAHSSYFQIGNSAVNKEVFGRFIGD